MALAFSEISVRKCGEYFGSYTSDTLAEALTYKAEANLRVNGSSEAFPIITKASQTYKDFYNGPDKVLDQAYAYMIEGDCFLSISDFTQASSKYVSALDVIEKLSATKTCSIFYRLILRLIYITQKLEYKNISERYIDIYKSHFREKNILTLRNLHKSSPLDVLENF